MRYPDLADSPKEFAIPPMLRNILAVITGTIAGVVVHLTTLPLPEPSWVLVIAAHLGQAFVGGWIAARLGTRPIQPAMIVGVVSLGGGIANAMLFGTPSWTWIEMPFYPVVAWSAGWLECKRRAA